MLNETALLMLNETALVNTDVKNELRATAFSYAVERMLPFNYTLSSPNVKRV